MSLSSIILLSVILSVLASPALSASATSSCPASLTPTNNVKPSVASGYRVALVATGLTKPRSIHFDTLGNLLVVQAGAGITNLVLQDNGGTCVRVKSKKDVINNDDVGIHFVLPDPYVHLVIAEPWPGSVKRWKNPLCLIVSRGLFLAL